MRAQPQVPRLRRGRQQGVTLIVVLLILIVVTVLGIGGAQIALLGERSTRYDRDYLVASQAAEAALMDAETDIRGPNTASNKRDTSFNSLDTGLFVEGCGTTDANRGMCAPNADGAKPVWATVNFLDTSNTAPTVEFGTYTGRSFDAGSSGVRPALKPRYIIEVVEDAAIGTDASGGKAGKLYRVTAMGFGPRTDIQVVMQIAIRKMKG